MKSFGIVILCILWTAFFLYSLFVISAENACTSVRQYACASTQEEDIAREMSKETNSEKNEELPPSLDIKTQILSNISEEKIQELRQTSDLFAEGCENSEVNVTLWETSYEINYQSCDLQVNIYKDKNWVESVKMNGVFLTEEEIALFF